MTVVTNRVAYDFLRPLQRFPWLCIDLADVVIRTEKTAQYQQIVELWGERSPIFRLPGEILDKGQQILRGWGIPEGAWFVPVHARDSIYSPSDEYVHRYRNCDIANFSKAVDAIIARGGWCIRMGEKGTPSLSEREGLVNYPDTPFKSDWMDLFLCNQARFFLGNTSGLKLVATISGVPCAAANIAPYEAIYGFLPSDISIPKLLRFKDGTTPRFEEIFDSDLSKCHWAWRFEEAGITFIENTPEEIAELASEMLDVLDRNPHRTPEDEALQHAFRALMKPWHYTFGTRSRIGKVFLRDNAHLI
jgi:putative glycosyltransferase (TIGR04372 family)